MSGVNSSVQHSNENTVCYRFAAVLAMIFLLLVILSLSGCLESADEGPDLLPEPYELNESLENSGIEEDVVSNHAGIGKLTVTSSSFENDSMIPQKYTCDGENINPSLDVGNIPVDCVSLLLIMEDPDAPSGTFTHWVVWNIDPNISIAEDSIMGIEGVNSAGRISYTGPCPPSLSHRYFFNFYALDTKLDIESGSARSLVENAMDGHVIAYGELVGKYSRS
ncbi:YbhB/YbcL family Raf kinase inhibitor-like protein [Methanolobus psychrotolerans]|uniref:YbhB/YbcL family Raf kinase inhibitor-like protein n=1 Tax=Methanolobus psychrotolerans TaxID=1874706 RepID=UPI001F5C6EC0|nr:YbhB/YbcL family Raf kinase inhibitor-like protein [Methanolobus psychrotolerans]